MIRLFISTLTLLFLMAGFAAASEQDRQKAVDMVTKAVDMVKTQGLDQTVAAANDPKGGLVEGDIYIYILKNDGMVLANGGTPAIAGKNMIGLKDSDGVEFIRAQAEQAQKGPGWVTYKWTNPSTKKLQDKESYVMAVPGTDVWIGCGVYK